LLPTALCASRGCSDAMARRWRGTTRSCSLLFGNTQRRGWSCMVEPTIPIRAGVRRPEIMLYQDTGPACIIDAQVVAVNADLSVSHHRKCDYYDEPEITSWVHHQTEAREVIYLSVTLSWRCHLAGNVCPGPWDLVNTLLPSSPRKPWRWSTGL